MPVARAVVVTLFLGVAFAGIDNVALVFLSRDVLGAGAIGFGVVAAAFGIGMLAASIALSGGRSRVAASAVPRRLAADRGRDTAHRVGARGAGWP